MGVGALGASDLPRSAPTPHRATAGVPGQSNRAMNKRGVIEMSESTDAFLVEWHRIVLERDVPALGVILSEDITMGAPPYWDKLSGRELVQHLLGLIVHTIDDFTYHREWVDGAELALEFTGHVGELEVQGIDLLTLDERHQVVNLDVLMRPVNAVVELREIIRPQMAAYLTGVAGR
jgi:hypothetical protein